MHRDKVIRKKWSGEPRQKDLRIEYKTVSRFSTTKVSPYGKPEYKVQNTFICSVPFRLLWLDKIQIGDNTDRARACVLETKKLLNYWTEFLVDDHFPSGMTHDDAYEYVLVRAIDEISVEVDEDDAEGLSPIFIT